MAEPTLKRFFVLHFVLPLIAVGVSIMHLIALHEKGSSNPLGIESLDNVYFYPKYLIKDLFGFIMFYGPAVYFFVLVYPNALGHPDNYTMANSLVTPKHITPE